MKDGVLMIIHIYAINNLNSGTYKKPVIKSKTRENGIEA
ncbi:hypothetical protein MNB_SUP05-SYMBIONT-7-97 [hydrothermal vent metagenome]|uniref:Uncharacterized protein n=1 Tax=hydrothermal vent metagenome TaxID=652676 RepID=A0A1W1E3D8_9ZZZZ